MTQPVCCRLCSAPLSDVFVDLGSAPLANNYLPSEARTQPEVFYPLCVYECSECQLVQLPAFETPQRIFGDEYLYFSSYSTSWLEQCRRYTSEMVERFSLSEDHLVVEVASNDGYLLQYFRERSIPVLGIEPAPNVAKVAETQRGVPTIARFFGTELAEELVGQGRSAQLLTANNVLAHVPDPRDFVAGVRILLAPQGVATFEFPHLMNLIDSNQFDTVYHEHFSYFSFLTACRLMEQCGLRVFDVARLNSHGGSLRLFVCQADASFETHDTVRALTAEEQEKGYADGRASRGYPDRVANLKHDVLRFLLQAKEEGKDVAGYGAPAKGNTLLSYCGIRPDLLPYTVDRSPHKQGRFLPGTHIPVLAPEELALRKPDYVWLLPWNLTAELTEQLAYVRDWGGRFFVSVPEPRILP